MCGVVAVVLVLWLLLLEEAGLFLLRRAFSFASRSLAEMAGAGVAVDVSLTDSASTS